MLQSFTEYVLGLNLFRLKASHGDMVTTTSIHTLHSGALNSSLIFYIPGGQIPKSDKHHYLVSGSPEYLLIHRALVFAVETMYMKMLLNFKVVTI